MYIKRAINHGTEADTTLPSLRRYFTDIHGDFLIQSIEFANDIKWILSRWSLIQETNNCLYNIQNVLLRFNSNFKLFYMPYMFLRKDDSREQTVAFANALLKLFILLDIVEAGYSTTRFKPFLFNINMEIGKGTSTEQIIQKIYEHITKSFNKTEIEKQIAESDVGGSLIYLNEVLFSIENGASLGFLSRKNYNIEHIMPASGKDIDAIRADAGIASVEEFSSLANKLGNKILLEENINKSAGRDSFIIKKQNSVKKKSGYKDSSYPIAKSLSSYPKDTWGKKDIEDSTQKAVSRICGFIFDKESKI